MYKRAITTADTIHGLRETSERALADIDVIKTSPEYMKKTQLLKKIEDRKAAAREAGGAGSSPQLKRR